MRPWSIHFLNARGELSEQLDWLQQEVWATKELIEESAPSLALDIVIRASDHPMPPSLIVAGAALGPGRIELMIDLQNTLGTPGPTEHLRRTLIHEFHHAMRWEGPGYGRTLGEALASEGLAQHFVHEVVSCPPEPWETVVPDEQLPALARRAEPEFDDPGYSHPAWFFGNADLPVWAGYTLGRAMISTHLKLSRHETALSLALCPASLFRKALSDIAKGS